MSIMLGAKARGVRWSADLQLSRRHGDVDLDAAVDQPDRIRVDRKDGREGLDLAGAQVKARSVPRALDETVLELALSEDAAVVGADVVDRPPGAILAVTKAEAL